MTIKIMTIDVGNNKLSLFFVGAFCFVLNILGNNLLDSKEILDVASKFIYFQPINVIIMKKWGFIFCLVYK